MPRAKSRQLPRPKVYTAGNWQGMDDTPDPVAAKPTFVALARNCYIPPRSFGASYLGRPGTTKAGSQLGSSTNRHAQYIGQFTKQDGTEYTVLVFEGEIYTYSWGGDAWTKQVTTANLTTATITLSATARVHGVVFQNTLVGFNRYFFIAAVKPFIYGAWFKSNTCLSESAQGIWQLVFAAFNNIVIDEVFKFSAQALTVFEIIDANHG